MSKNNRERSELLRAYTLLGQRVARKDKLLAETSCMNPEIREMIGAIDAYHSYFECNDFMDERKALCIMARITWPRKESIVALFVFFDSFRG